MIFEPYCGVVPFLKNLAQRGNAIFGWVVMGIDKGTMTRFNYRRV
ncbi:MAG: hypothetical protein ACI8WM_000920 [Burkholderiaceae bacterium]|jgi:hypothetical protein